MTQPIPESAHHLLDDVNYAHVVTLMADGMPQTTPVWVTRDDGVAVFNTSKGRAKHRNLERDQRVALSVHNHANPYEYLQIRGRAELVEEGAEEQIDELSRKYTGHDYASRAPGMQRITVRVLAEAIDYHPRG